MWCVRLEDPSVLAGEAQPPGGDQPDGRQGPSFGAGGSVTSVPGGWGSRGSPARESMAEPSDRGPGSRRVAGCPAWRPTFQVEPSTGTLARRFGRRCSFILPSRVGRRRASGEPAATTRIFAGRRPADRPSPRERRPSGDLGPIESAYRGFNPSARRRARGHSPDGRAAGLGSHHRAVGGRSRRGIVVAPLERRTVGWPT